MNSLTDHNQTIVSAIRPAPPLKKTSGPGQGQLFCALALPGASSVAAKDLPSGQTVQLQEVIVEQVSNQTVVRFRFIAPAIARNSGTLRFPDAESDMAALCEFVAIPYIKDRAIAAHSVIISLADRAVEFGFADPDATQFFEAYRLENGTCIWEAF